MKELKKKIEHLLKDFLIDRVNYLRVDSTMNISTMSNIEIKFKNLRKTRKSISQLGMGYFLQLKNSSRVKRVKRSPKRKQKLALMPQEQEKFLNL